MNSVGIFFIVFFVLLIAGAVGWVVFTQLRARRLGLPAPTLSSYNPFSRSESSPYGPPTPAPGGIRGWINDKLRRSRNPRSAAGAYEQSHGNAGAGRSRGGGGGGSFGALDPDDAWDTRVGGAESYGYEEQELGARDPYGGSGYPMNIAATPGYGGGHGNDGRGRSRSRDDVGDRGLDVHGGGYGGARRQQNPFDDDAAEPSNISLRGVSPRPIDTSVDRRGGGPQSDSPTERRSVFRENV